MSMTQLTAKRGHGNGQKYSYVTVIVVHLTMNLKHDNYCHDQVTIILKIHFAIVQYNVYLYACMICIITSMLLNYLVLYSICGCNILFPCIGNYLNGFKQR